MTATPDYAAEGETVSLDVKNLAENMEVASITATAGSETVEITEIVANEKYSFVMPAGDVQVDLSFKLAEPSLNVVNCLTGEIIKLSAADLEGVAITELAEKLGCLTATWEGKTYAFAGWYTEAQPDGYAWTAKAATDENLVVDSTIYAYFINVGYLKTTIAYTSNNTKATRMYALSSVPSDIFGSYGILLSTAASADDNNLVRGGAPIDGLKIKDVNKTTVYQYISVAPFTAKTTANNFNGNLGGANNGDGYLTYAAVTNMPLNKTVSARAYYVTQDGTVVYGATAHTPLEANKSVTGLN